MGMYIYIYIYAYTRTYIPCFVLYIHIYAHTYIVRQCDGICCWCGTGADHHAVHALEGANPVQG